MKPFYALAPMLLPILATAQKTNPHYELPPTVPPASCVFTLASVGALTGPIAYRRLAIQLKALQSAQDGVSAMAAGMKGYDSEASPAVAMSSLFTGTEQAHDALLCSAFLAAKYKSIDKDDENARTLLIVAYNQEAAAIADLEAHIKEQFLRTKDERTQTVLEKDAERMTAITSLQQEAAITLSEVTVLSLMESVDISNPNAKDTKSTLIPCERYKELKAESTALSHGTKSAYTDAVSLFVTFLNGHTCK